MARHLALCSLVALAAPARLAWAQDAPARGVAGAVVEAESGAPLEGATVVLMAAGGATGAALGGDPATEPFLAATRSAVTDAAGEYRFDGVAPGVYSLRVIRLGFRPATVVVELRGDALAAPAARVSVGMTLVPVRLRAVSVTGATAEPFARHARSAQAVGDARLAALRQRQARLLSTDVREVTQADVAEGVTLGETDLFRALQRLPGVSARNDVSAELWTRGARWDQTRVTWDGLPLYNPLHVGALLSAVNSDAVGAAFLHPGVRPAAIGEGGAAVLDLRSRPGGGVGRARAVGELSLLSARATLDQTVDSGRGAWMLSGRRTYADVLARGLLRDGTHRANFPYYFAELAGRADWRLGARHTLEASALRSQDHLTDGYDEVSRGASAQWGNSAARVTLTGPARLGPLGAVTLRHTLGVSEYIGRIAKGARTDTAYGAILFRGQDLRPVDARIRYLALTGEVAPAGPGAPAWTGGYELMSERGRIAGPLQAAYGSDYRDTLGVAHLRLAGGVTQLGAWAERRLYPAPRLTIAGGVRAEGGTRVPGGGIGGVLRLAPRLMARYALPDSQTFLSAAAGRSYQYVQAAPTDPSGDPQDAFIPLWALAGAGGGASGTVAPALRTDLATLGVERWLGAGWHATANAYVRRSAGLLVDDPRPGPIVEAPLFVVGREAGRGAEFGVRRIAGRWTAGLGAVAYGRTSAAGFTYASPQEQRQVLGATSMWRVGAGWRLGAAYSAATGAPFTRRTQGGWLHGEVTENGTYRPFPEPRYVLGSRETPGEGRLPAANRLDLLFDWTGHVRRVRTGVYVQVHNVTVRDNPVGYTGTGCFSVSSDQCVGRDDRVGPGLPLIPLVGVRFGF